MATKQVRTPRKMKIDALPGKVEGKKAEVFDLEVAMAQFKLDLEDGDYSDKTIIDYTRQLRGFYRWAREEVELGGSPKFAPRDVVAYRRWMLERGRGVSFVNQALAAVKTYAGWQAEKMGLDSDWAAGVRTITITRAPKWGLLRNEYHALLRLLLVDETPSRDKAVFALLLGCGMRRREAVGVTVNDVLLHRAQRGASGSVWARFGKGAKAREVPFSGWRYEVLRDRMDELVAEAGEEGNQSANTPLLGITADGVRDTVERWGKKAGLDLHPHKLRRTYGQMLRKAGFSIESVSRMMGHSSIDITAIYTDTPSGKFDEVPDLD